jgi:hypothetical protein
VNVSESNTWAQEMVQIAEQGTAIAYETWPEWDENDGDTSADPA